MSPRGGCGHWARGPSQEANSPVARRAVFIGNLGGLLADRHRRGDVGFYFNLEQVV